jgi:Co/Zn/Cd efflux system component
MDPRMGVRGAALVTRRSLGLLRNTGAVLPDNQAPEPVQRAIRRSIERDDDHRVADLRVRAIGPGVYSVALSVVAGEPLNPDTCKRLPPLDPGLTHVTVEVHRSPDDHGHGHSNAGPTAA